MNDPLRVGIALGSNIGDRLQNLRLARERILALPWAGPALCASVYETAPVDCAPGTASFLNTVMDVQAGSDCPDPPALLAALLEIERQLGRPSRHPRNAPRPIDLDLLYFGNLECHSALLTLPHPRLALRRFVLAPLAEIRPSLILPGEKLTAAERLLSCPDAGDVERVLTVW